MKTLELRIRKLKDKIKQWDELAKDNPNNIHNLSTSERQDWIDELDDLKDRWTDQLLDQSL